MNAHRYIDRSASDRRYEGSQFPGTGYINDEHEQIVAIAEDVPGRLQRADHLKLYEMAWFARGPILEVGLDQGKSASIMARAVASSGNGAVITSLELQAPKIASVAETLAALGLSTHVRLIAGRSEDVIRTLPESFDLVFLDGDHSYAGVSADLVSLQGRIGVGGAILFHDYWDARNDDPSNNHYGVRAAVEDLAGSLGLRFLGGFGAIALYEQT